MTEDSRDLSWEEELAQFQLLPFSFFFILRSHLRLMRIKFRFSVSHRFKPLDVQRRAQSFGVKAMKVSEL
jgi:hypothetical protein